MAEAWSAVPEWVRKAGEECRGLIRLAELLDDQLTELGRAA
jgi:hypothetical protein